MELTIKSRKLKRTLTFSRPGRAYIFVDINGMSGTLGQQICAGGALSGSTLQHYGDDYKEFERICRSWYRSYMRG